MGYVYSASGNNTNTVSVTKPLFNLLGAATRRLKIFEIFIGCDAAPPDDQVSRFALMRTTARGTQTATVAPNAFDPEAPASIATLDTAWSVDPTITALSVLYEFALNQRAPYRWVCPPGCEIIVPMVTGAGLALVSVGASSPESQVFTILWRE